MAVFINFSNRKLIDDLVQKLGADDIPLWGKMKPQQMVEHLVESVEYTNGKYSCECDLPAAEAQRQLQANVYPDTEIPRNVILGTLPDHYRFESLQTAIDQLMIELEAFDRYFAAPGITAMHAGFGPMNHHEWLLWHGKHFTHHFKQFSLIS